MNDLLRKKLQNSWGITPETQVLISSREHELRTRIRNLEAHWRRELVHQLSNQSIHNDLSQQLGKIEHKLFEAYGELKQLRPHSPIWQHAQQELRLLLETLDLILEPLLPDEKVELVSELIAILETNYNCVPQCLAPD